MDQSDLVGKGRHPVGTRADYIWETQLRNKFGERAHQVGVPVVGSRAHLVSPPGEPTWCSALASISGR